MNCIFCQIIQGKLPSERVYEDEDTIAILDIAPVSRGHTLVISKKHFGNLPETPDEVLARMIAATKKIGQAMLKGLTSEGFNVGVNSGRAAGQLIDHIHFHIIPRSSSDNLRQWVGRKYEAGEMGEVGKLLRGSLN